MNVNRLDPSEPAAKRAPFYTLFFHQHPEGRSYFLRRFGAQLAVWVLDSGHLADFAGAQEVWLERSLREHRDTRFRFALYHVSLYPSHRPYDGSGPRAGRRHWVPLFDAFGLTAAFENHEHLLKRTHPLRAGALAADGQGTLYIGDGCWGKSHVRKPVGDRWYLAKTLRRRHVWSVTRVGRRGPLHRPGSGRAGIRRGGAARGVPLARSRPLPVSDRMADTGEGSPARIRPEVSSR